MTLEKVDFDFPSSWLQKCDALEDGACFTAGALSLDGLASRMAEFVKSPFVSQYLLVALGTLVHQQRVEKGLSIDKLATDAEVDVGDLSLLEANGKNFLGIESRKIEHIEFEPRQIFNLAKVLDLPVIALNKLAGLTAANDSDLYGEAVRFAASSKGTDHLSSHERNVLKDFIRLLAKE